MIAFTNELRRKFEQDLREVANNSSSTRRSAYANIIQMLENNETLAHIKSTCAKRRSETWELLEIAQNEHKPLVELLTITDSYAAYRLVLAFLDRYDYEVVSFGF